MPKVAQAVKIESPKQFGQCSACLEMTTLEDPCCPFAGVIINGEYKRPMDARDRIISELVSASKAALKLLRGSGFTENTQVIQELAAAIVKAEFGDEE